MEEHKILQDINNLNREIDRLIAERNILETKKQQLEALAIDTIGKYSIVEIEDHIWFVVKIGDTVREIEFYDNDIEYFEDIYYGISSLVVVESIIHTVDKETFTSELCRYLKHHHQRILSKFEINEEIS